jgi:hypothetical protein
MQEFTSNGWQDLTYNYMDRYLPFTGGTMFGPITLAADPTTNLQAATRQYVDNKILSSVSGVASFNARTGVVTLTLTDVNNAMTGSLDMGSHLIINVQAPQTPLGVANKAYVDSAVSGVPGGALISDTAPTAVPGALWWDSLGGQMYVRYDDTNSVQWVTTHNESTSQLYTDNAVAGTLNNVGRNKLHNSMFNVAQRGAGPFTTNGSYCGDRWQVAISLDTGTYVINTATDTVRSQIGDEAVDYVFGNSVTGNAGAASFSQMYQRIENVRRLAGKTVIVSFWMNASAAKIGVSLDQNMGSGGSPSAAVNGNGVAITAPSNMARVSATFTLPSLSGKTLGTNGDHNTQLNLWFSSGTTQAIRAGSIGVQTGGFNIWGVQLEIAQPGQTQPTPLEKPDPVQQLQQCQRFYCVGRAAASSNATIATQVALSEAVFPVTMRAAPSMAFANQSYSNGSSATAAGVANGSFTFQVNSVATGMFYGLASYTASADL